MFGLGITEILFLAILALIVIGPKQLPEVARTIGRFLNDIKRNTESFKEDLKSRVDLDLDIHRKNFSEQIKIQQENLRQQESKQGLPIPEEDRQLTLDGIKIADAHDIAAGKKENN